MAGENIIRTGLVLVMFSIIELSRTGFGSAVHYLFWLALIVFIMETYKLHLFSEVNAILGEVVISVILAFLALKGLLSAFGQGFSEYHVLLLILLIGSLTMLYGANKKLG